MSTTEFDEYAEQYEDLLSDPIRNRFAQDAGFFTRRKWELLQRYFLRHELQASDMDWLDVGCGTGTLLRLGKDSFRSASGCDPSRKMLETCRDLDVHVQQEDRLPFETNSFDLVTMVCVMHHVQPPGRAALMAEIARVVRPGGLACMIEHNPWNPATQLIVSRTPVDRDAVLLTSGTAKQLFRAAGMEPRGSEYFLYFPEVLYSRIGFLEGLGSRVPLGGQYATFARGA